MWEYAYVRDVHVGNLVTTAAGKVLRPPIDREDKAVKKAGKQLFTVSPSTEEEDMDTEEVEAYDPTKVKPVSIKGGHAKAGSATSGSRGSSRRGSTTAEDRRPAEASAAQQAFNAQLAEEARARRQQKIDTDLAKAMAKKMTPPSKEARVAQTPERRDDALTPTFSPASNPDEATPGTSGVTVYTDGMEEEEKIYEVADPDKPVNFGEAVVADLHLLEEGDDDEAVDEAIGQEPEEMNLGEEETPPPHFHIEGEAVVAEPTTEQP